MVGGTKTPAWPIMPFTPQQFSHIRERCTVTYHAEPFLKLPLDYVSGFWLLIPLLVLSSGPAYAEWIAVEKNNQLAGIMTVYVDPDTIHRKGDLVTMWQLNDFKTMQGGRSPSRFSSTKIQKQFDCTEERLRLLALTDFWGNMGTGEPAGAYVDRGHWVPVEPDSINQALWEVACNKQ
jgi:surface-adhesin protein E